MCGSSRAVQLWLGSFKHPGRPRRRCGNFPLAPSNDQTSEAVMTTHVWEFDIDISWVWMIIRPDMSMIEEFTTDEAIGCCCACLSAMAKSNVQLTVVMQTLQSA